MAEWCNLPSDLLADIALKLDSVEDFISFSTVCRQWKHVYSMVKRTLWSTVKIPWLLLVENLNDDNPNRLRKVYNPDSNRCYQLKLPQTFGSRCWGVGHGWIVMISLDKKIQLFNPITKAEINLPSMKTMPYYARYDNADIQVEVEWYRTIFIHRLIVLKLPQNSGGAHQFFVLAIHGEFSYLSFTRPGEQSWTLVPTPERRLVGDVVYVDGLVFILYQNGTLGYCDIKVSQNLESMKVVDYVPPPPASVSAFMHEYNKYYLVELDGDLLMIIRYKNSVMDENNPEEYNLDVVYRTRRFEVYSLDSKDQVWQQVENLGDIALFVGSNPVIPLHVTKGTTNIKCNCIYFTDDEEECWDRVIGYGGHDMGMFDMKTKNISLHYDGDDTRSEFCPPQWFVPLYS